MFDPAKALLGECEELPLVVSADRDKCGGEEDPSTPGRTEPCLDVPCLIPSPTRSSGRDLLVCGLALEFPETTEL
jgi:hypothetical protein